MSRLEIHLLGEFSANLEQVELSRLHVPRLQTLLAYLILHPQAQFRHYLAALFWPDSSEPQARTNLRNQLHQLRAAIPALDDYIEANAQTLQWRKNAPCRVDVREFEQSLAVALPDGHTHARERLERAAALYAGDLLPACYDDWILAERERLRRAYLSVLEALIQMAEEARDYPAALQAALRLVHADPLHAAANHQLIRLHALNGSQPAALKAYQSYAARLQAELGIQPDAETRELYAQLKRQKTPPVSGSAPAQRLALVGRQGEWTRLHSVWHAAAKGSPQMALIAGEAGIGKTRLVEELLEWASRQGIQTATASCYPAEGSLPFSPVTSWLRSRPLPRLENIWLTEIARVLPEVQREAHKLPEPKPLTEAWQRQRMFEAFAKALLGDKAALLLVIDDIHWCDQDTLEWIHYLLRSDPKAALLLVATERSEESFAPNHPLNRLKTALAAENKISEIRLNALNEENCLRLASQVAQEETRQALSAEIAARIYRESEGNPLFIVEMTRLGSPLYNSGASSPQPHKVQTVLKWRIGQLSASTRDLACAAAVLGREFHLDVLQQVCKMADAPMLQALNELLLRQIVREQSAERYDFSHDKLRQAVLNEMSAAHRRLLHRKAAEAYLALPGDPTRVQHAEIAHHYESAGMTLPAIQHYHLAAEAAARLLSNADAIDNMEHALGLAKSSGLYADGLLPAEEYAKMLEKLADLHALEGKYPRAHSGYAEALAAWGSAANLWRSQVYRKISEALGAIYLHEQAQAALDQAEKSLGALADDLPLAEKQEWLEIQLVRCQQHYWGNRPEQIEKLIQIIGPMIEAVGRTDQKISFLYSQIQARFRQERFRTSQKSLDIARHRLDLAEKFTEGLTLAVAHFQYGFALLWHGDYARAHESLLKGYNDTARFGARLWQLRALTYLSVTSRKLGDLAATRAEGQQTLELALALNEPTYLGIGQANLGWLAWKDGKTAEAQRLCTQAVQTWSEFGGNVFHSLAYWVLLATALQQQHLEQAKSCAQHLLDPNPLYRPVNAECASALRAALDSPDTQEASALFTRALDLARADNEL